MSRPTPTWEVVGSGRGVSRPTPGGSRPTQMATAVDGMHPTGMHSCCVIVDTHPLWNSPLVTRYPQPI